MGIFQGQAKSSTGQDGDFELPPADNQPAVLVGIIDLGTQHVDGYQGAAARDVRQVYLVWELTDAPVTGTQNNHVLGAVYTLSFHEKAALRLMLEAWKGHKHSDGENIAITDALGKPCLLNVIHGTSKNSGKSFAKIDAKGVTRLPKSVPAPKPKRSPFVWELEAEGGGLHDPRELPDWLPFIYGVPVKDVIGKAKEYSKHAVKPGSTVGNGDQGGGQDDDLPEGPDNPF